MSIHPKQDYCCEMKFYYQQCYPYCIWGALGEGVRQDFVPQADYLEGDNLTQEFHHECMVAI